MQYCSNQQCLTKNNERSFSDIAAGFYVWWEENLTVACFLTENRWEGEILVKMLSRRLIRKILWKVCDSKILFRVTKNIFDKLWVQTNIFLNFSQFKSWKFFKKYVQLVSSVKRFFCCSIWSFVKILLIQIMETPGRFFSMSHFGTP